MSYPTFVSNCKLLGTVLLEKSLTQIPYALHGSERWKKGKPEKEAKNKSQHLGFFLMIYCTWPLSRRIQTLKTLALTEAENSVRESFIERKQVDK